MNIVETLNEGLKRAFTIIIPASEIDGKVDAQLKTMAPRIKMPGFRPGKVPANLVRKMHGPALQQEALNAAVQESVQKTIADKGLRPAMQPEVSLNDDYAPGQDAEIKLSLEALPDLPEPSIAGLKLERLVVEADAAAVDAALQKLADGQRSSEPAPADHVAVAGDTVVMDFVGKVDGVPFDGGTGEGMQITLGSGQLIPGFEDQLVGVKANEERQVQVTFPEDYNVETLKGKPATFDIVVTEVRTPKEAVADDEFAKGLGLEGIDQLRELMKGQVEQETGGLTRTHMKRKLLDQLAASHDFAVPETMVDAEFEQIWRQLEHEAGHEADPEKARADMEAERGDYRAIAERRVRLGLLLSEIGNRNGIGVTENEMNRLIAQAAQQYAPKERERFIEYVQGNAMASAQLRAPLFEDKVVDWLFSQAEITDRNVGREELEAAIESEEGALPGGHVHGPDCNHDHDHAHEHGDAQGEATAAEPAAKPKRARKAKAEVLQEASAAAEVASDSAAADAVAEVAPVKKPRAKKVKAEG
jgi:trigger factor